MGSSQSDLETPMIQQCIQTYRDVLNSSLSNEATLSLLSNGWSVQRSVHNEKFLAQFYNFMRLEANETEKYQSDTQAYQKFFTEVRRTIIYTNAEKIAKSMVSLSSSDQEYLLGLHIYDADTVRLMYERAIDTMYGLRSVREIHEFLLMKWNTAAQTDFQFSQMLHAQLFLYYKFVGRSDLDRDYLDEIGFTLTTISKNPMFDQLSDDMKKRCTKALIKILN